MFYPADSLKRGGRFYLCWVADSWPQRFASISHRQLWAQDIRKLCKDLLEVMNNESGRPTNRFSLRLSSQLMRGLVRLYERKVTVLLGEICMINAKVFSNTNKKWGAQKEAITLPRTVPQLPTVQVILPQELEEEPRVEEMIRNSGNMVLNVQDITLREATIPEFQLPPNDNFGEDHPDQAYQLLMNRTVEQMLSQTAAPAQVSGLDLLETDISRDKSHDRSRLQPQDMHQMERIEEHDVTMFRKSEGLPPTEFEKDIPEIPDVLIPDILIPEITPIPDKDTTVQEPEIQVPAVEVPKPVREVPEIRQPSPEDIELEQLDEGQLQSRKRRAKNTKLIIDKKTKLNGQYLRARIQNTKVELRCEDSSLDIVDTRPGWALLSTRPTRPVGLPILWIYRERLAAPTEERETETIEQPMARRTRSVLETIVEEEIVPPVLEPIVQIDVMNEPIDVPNEPIPEQRVSVVEPMDIADLPTQKLESPKGNKRTSEVDTVAKKPRLSGYVSFRESQNNRTNSQSEIIEPVFNEPDKENIPPKEDQTLSRPDRVVASLLQAAGLTDPQSPHATQVANVTNVTQVGNATQVANVTQPTQKQGSESPETQLGSLDRTKVSLGDSERTTDSQRFIRHEWGLEGTMVKILKRVKTGLRPITVERLVANGPVLADYRNLIVARCFTSILKLKQHAFIKIEKDPDTLAIVDITLGSVFD